MTRKLHSNDRFRYKKSKSRRKTGGIKKNNKGNNTKPYRGQGH